jgi:2-C-methyl-D-erythritol 4-phosphate cytidylyltransferase
VAVAGRPMVEWSIAAFRAAESVCSIVIAAPAGHVHELAGGDVGVVAGGRTRAESVSRALEAVGTELVAVHDAARPLITSGLIEDLVSALEGDPRADGVIAATPVADTIKEAGVGDRALIVEATLERNRLWAAQTPQLFRVGALREALAAKTEGCGAATDEAMLVEAAGGRVLIHPSPAENLKVTTPLDLRLAELLLADSA